MPTHNIHHLVLPDHHTRPANPATRPGAYPASSQLPRQPHPARRRAARPRTSPLTARLLVANTQRKPSNLSAEPPKSRSPTASVPFPPCLPQKTSFHTSTAAQPFPLLIPSPPRARPDYHQPLPHTQPTHNFLHASAVALMPSQYTPTNTTTLPFNPPRPADDQTGKGTELRVVTKHQRWLHSTAGCSEGWPVWSAGDTQGPEPRPWW